MGKSIQDMFDSIIEEFIAKSNEQRLEVERANRVTDYRKFSKSINELYGSFTNSSEKLSLVELDENFYDDIKKQMKTLWTDYSYTKCEEWMSKLKDQFHLYYIDETGYEDKKKQLYFYKQFYKIVYKIYQKVHINNENDLVQARKVYNNSCNIFSLLEESIKLSGDLNVIDESDEYSNCTNEDLIKQLKILDRTSSEKRDNREGLEELDKRIDILAEILDRDDIEDKKTYFNEYRKLNRESKKKSTES